MPTPTVHLTDAAKQAILDATAEEGGAPLRITISEAFRHDLRLDTPSDADVAIDCGGVTLLLDPSSAGRAEGLSIDFVTRPEGAGFTVQNPNQPPAVRQLSAPELKAMIDAGASFELVDVRTEEERAVARIDGSRLLDEAGHGRLLALDRDTPLVFQCHHGIRSQSAAEYFLQQGFGNVYNLQGGIDAWSQLVDPSVPRY
jgi:monothiol glutaredoxin